MLESMTTLAWIFIATFFNGLIALIGGFALFLKGKSLDKLISILVAFATGTLLGGAFFHLIPEALEFLPSMKVSLYILIGFGIFFVIERILHWHHCHKQGNCETHPVSYLVLFGDGIHNLADGLIIAAAFLVDTKLGIITTLLIIAHEIPQELGDFAILIKSKMKPKLALFFNFISQCTAIVGGLIGYKLGADSQNFVPFILPFAAGGFIYIAASDLIPELHKEESLKKSLINFLIFILGVVFMYYTKVLFE